MRKIICVSLNPAMDKTVMIEHLEEGYVNKIEEIDYQIGGKGINVGKVLMNFGIKSIVTGFIGGVWADTFRTKLMKLGIETKFFKLLHDTRVNTKLIDKETGICTALNEVGPYVPEELVERFIQSFTLMCHEGDIIVLTGGVSPSIPEDIYYTLGRIAKEKGACVILDAKNTLLAKGLLAKPDMVKLNYRNYIPKDNWHKLTKEMCLEIIQYAKTLGVPKVLISLGKKGALFINGEKTYYAEAIDVGVELRHPVAAGDAMVAALVMSLIEEFEDAYTLKYAIACGAACVLSKDTNGCTPMQVNELLSQVQVEKIQLK